jgi:hypothetical protein
MPSQSLPAWAVLGVEAARFVKEFFYSQPRCVAPPPVEIRAPECPVLEWPAEACPAVTCPTLACPALACPEATALGVPAYVAGGALAQALLWTRAWCIHRCRNGARRVAAPTRRGGGVLA